MVEGSSWGPSVRRFESFLPRFVEAASEAGATPRLVPAQLARPATVADE